MRFSVSHLRDARFEPRGLRSFFEYRDLGIKEATGGKVLGRGVVDTADNAAYRYGAGYSVSSSPA